MYFNCYKLHKEITQVFRENDLYFNFRILTDSIFSKQKVISLTLFRISNPYKNEMIYKKGLKNWLEVMKRNEMSGFTLWLYIDKSFFYKDDLYKGLFYNIKHYYKNVIIIMYELKDFKKDKIYHSGLVGTLIRYFPVFNFNFNEHNFLITSDVDLHYKDIEKKIDYILKSQDLLKEGDFIFKNYSQTSFVFKGRLMLDDILEKYDFDIRFIAEIVFGKLIDKSILINFFKCVKRECNVYINWIEEIKKYTYFSDKFTQEEKKQLTSRKDSKFIFGIDELFINYYIVSYLFDNKLEFIFYDESKKISDPLYYISLFNYLLVEFNVIKKDFLVYLFKYVLEDSYEKDNMEKNFETITMDDKKMNKRLILFLKNNKEFLIKSIKKNYYKRKIKKLIYYFNYLKLNTDSTYYYKLTYNNKSYKISEFKFV